MKKQQLNYSFLDPKMCDLKERSLKAEKIIAILADYDKKRNVDFHKYDVLELGCSAGGMTKRFASMYKKVTAVDIDEVAIKRARGKYKNLTNVTFLYGSALSLPLPSRTFDLVICNHVYEHVTSSKKMMDEIYRVLRSKGICYFSGPQKYTIIEPHYSLPFLSWFPKPLASIYLRLVRGIPYYFETPLSPRSISRLVRRFFCTDYTIRLLKDPRRFHATHPTQALLAKIPHFVYKRMYPFLPSFFMVLGKK